MLTIPPWPFTALGGAGVGSDATMNATGESVAVIGTAYVPGGGSKTLSAAGGGRIVVRAGAVTFANGGTNLRIGVQDVDGTTGFEDGTFDVYADLVGGTDTITASTFHNVPMETGSKTIASGDVIAIVAEMTARAGADSVALGTQSPSAALWAAAGFPYGSQDTGSLAKSASWLVAILVFDDGTTGWIHGMTFPLRNADTQLTYNSGSSPDEYCAVFTPPCGIRIDGMGLLAGSLATTDTYELILYQDPLGTPSALATVTPDTDIWIAVTLNNRGILRGTIGAFDLLAGVTYGVALRPTSANDITFSYCNFTDANGAIFKEMVPLFGTSVKLAGRTDQSGAFVETQTYHYPMLALNIIGIDGGAGALAAFGGTIVARPPGMVASGRIA